jgi:ABC-type Fe3+/spermidine/putrescine transport system ATPase subunit
MSVFSPKSGSEGEPRAVPGTGAGAGDLVVEHVTHSYGRSVALRDVSLVVPATEFVSLVGPSGCGKTTLLRIIAGFIRPTDGRVIIDGKDVTRVSAHRRAVRLVFQRPTIFPHLDVFDNVAFGLKVSRMPRDQVRERVLETLALVRLDGYEHRRAYALSGGQMQRVAMARALAGRPRLLLLDEPLAALDLRIRLNMEAELRRLHRETGATFVYVTHDQREAMSMSDRIVVFNHGVIEQVGSPEAVYNDPHSEFAARFVGDANVVDAEVRKHDGEKQLVVGGRVVPSRGFEDLQPGAVRLVLRAEAVTVANGPSSAPDWAFRGVVRDRAYQGSSYSYRIEIPGLGGLLKAELPAAASQDIAVDAEVVVSWAAESPRILPAAADAAPAEESAATLSPPDELEVM